MADKSQWGAQPYGQQPYPPNGPNPGNPQAYAPSQPQNAYTSDSKYGYTAERFQPKKRVNDIFFLIFFIATFLGFAAVSGIAINNYIKVGGLSGGLGGGANGGRSVTLNKSTIYLLLLVTAASLLFSALYFMLVRLFTRAIMHITLVASILLNIGICAYYWYTKYYSGAIIFTIIAILGILSYWGFRSRIPFASLLLQVVLDVANAHKSVYIVAFITLVLQGALSVWYVFTVIATYSKWSPNTASCRNISSANCSSGTVAGLIFFETFAYLWIGQVLANVSLATLAGGPFGSWYYYGPRSDGLMAKHPTTAAFVRASTLSLGSIAFGSLIVTILELLRLLAQIARNMATQDGDTALAILACVAECCIGCFEGMVQYFNRYAYIEIALYGKSYLESAKSTWSIFKDRGLDALVNDSLVSTTLTWGAYIVGLLCSLFAYVYLLATKPSYNSSGDFTAPILLYSFLIGIQASLSLSSALEAGVSTIFVGLAEDPPILYQRSPGLYNEIQKVYPQVNLGVQA